MGDKEHKFVSVEVAHLGKAVIRPLQPPGICHRTGTCRVLCAVFQMQFDLIEQVLRPNI